MKVFWKKILSAFWNLFKPRKRIAIEAMENVLDISFRLKAHQDLLELLQKGGKDETIAHFSLGNLYEPCNYSAQRERDEGKNLAQLIQEKNPFWERDVASLVREMKASPEKDLRDIVDHYSIDHLKIGVASEMAMILHPRLHLCINKRTLFTYFKFQKNEGKVGEAGGDLALVSQIMKDHHHWARWLDPVTRYFEEFFRQYLEKNYPGIRREFRFFYVEKFCSEFYRRRVGPDPKNPG